MKLADYEMTTDNVWRTGKDPDQDESNPLFREMVEAKWSDVRRYMNGRQRVINVQSKVDNKRHKKLEKT